MKSNENGFFRKSSSDGVCDNEGEQYREHEDEEHVEVVLDECHSCADGVWCDDGDAPLDRNLIP
jgi:hypothetical protein